MKYSVALLLFLLPFILSAQNEAQTGIRFENLASWSAVKEKAKQENKYIFVDCSATWCNPCKWMEKHVYPVDSIGRLFNANFISVRLQMDSTANDREENKTWYPDVQSLQNEYAIMEYPTYLFFSPEGKLVHRFSGARQAFDFYRLARNAANPRKQYYPMVERFEHQDLPYADMPYLANHARMLHDIKTADLVSKAYIDDSLLHLSASQLYSRENLRFIATFIGGSSDRSFKLFFASYAKVDSVMSMKGFSWNIIENILEKEEVNNSLYKEGKPFQMLTDHPDWDKLHRRIKKKYNSDYADRSILVAKLKWLENKKQWPEYCQNVIAKVEHYGPYNKFDPNIEQPNSFGLNLSAWELFCHCSDPGQLEKALEWSEKAIKTQTTPSGPNMDTYANLLYKLGRKTDAIVYEEKAVSYSPNDEEIKGNLAKMKKGEPTWTTE